VKEDVVQAGFKKDWKRKAVDQIKRSKVTLSQTSTISQSKRKNSHQSHPPDLQFPMTLETKNVRNKTAKRIVTSVPRH
jgi:hypothetical protein